MMALQAAGDRIAAAVAFLAPAVGVFAPKGMTVLLIVFALASLPRLSFRRLPPAVLGVLAALFVLAAWGALSSLWSLAPSDSLAVAARLVALSCAGLVAWLAASDAERPLAHWLLWGFVLAAVLLLVEILFRSPIRGLVQERPGSPELILTWWLNRGVTVIALLAWPAIVVAWRWRGWPAALAVGLLAAAAVFLGPQRSAYLAVLAGGLVFAAFWLAGQRFRLVLAGGLVLIVLTAPLVPRLLPAPEALQQSRPELTYSLIHRLHIWRFAADKTAMRPMTGWGMRSSRHLPGSEQLVPGAPGPARYLTLHPHNGVLQVWLELGFVGALAGAALVACLALGIGRAGDRFRAAAAGAVLASGFVFASLSYGLWQTWWFATLALAAAFLAAAGAQWRPDQAVDRVTNAPSE